MVADFFACQRVVNEHGLGVMVFFIVDPIVFKASPFVKEIAPKVTRIHKGSPQHNYSYSFILSPRLPSIVTGCPASTAKFLITQDISKSVIIVAVAHKNLSATFKVNQPALHCFALMRRQSSPAVLARTRR